MNRDQAYIGVMIDDLVTKGTREPYRMFTSRAEFRLVLREDNTIDRLFNVGKRLGTLSNRDVETAESLVNQKNNFIKTIREKVLVPNAATQQLLTKLETAVLLKPTTLEELLRRPELDSSHLSNFGVDVPLDPWVVEPAEIEVKYAGYITRQNEIVDQAKKLERLKLPTDLRYEEIKGLSREEVEKLTKVRPITLGQAQRISGVNPSAIQAVLVYIKGRKKIRDLRVGEFGV